MKMKKKFCLVLGLVALLAVGCSGTEEKKMKFFEKGKSFLEQNDLTRARLELKNAVQIDPKFGTAYFYLGEVEMRARDFQKAYGHYSKAVELEPGLWAAQLALGKLLAGARAWDKALEKAELVPAEAPEYVGAGILKAAVWMNQNKPDDARALLEKLLKGGATDEEIFLLLSQAALQRKAPAEARAMLEKGIAARPESVRLHLMLTDILARGKEFAAAQEALRKVIELEPESSDHRLRLVELLWLADRSDEARQLQNEVLEKNAGREEIFLQASRMHMAHGRVDETLQVLQKGIAAHPGGFGLRFALSELRMQRNQPAEAETILRECLTLKSEPDSPNLIQTKTLLAGVLLARGDLPGSQLLVDEVIAANPKSVDAHFTKGRLLLRQNKGQDAVSEFRSVIGEKPEMEMAHLGLAEAHLLNKEVELATDVLRKAIETLPSSKRLRQAMARLLVSRKDFSGAEKQLTEILTLDPADHQVRAALGDVRAADGRLDLAEVTYLEITRLAADQPLGYLKLAEFYQRQKKTSQAIGVLEKAYTDHPDSFMLLAGWVKTLVVEQQFDKAAAACQTHLDRARAGVSDAAPVHNLLGLVYLAARQYDRAQQTLEKAIALQPEWPVAYGNLAQLYLIQNKVPEAVAKYQAALNADPRNAALYLALAALHERQNQLDQARAVYEKALSARPDLWAAANNLAFLLAEQNAVAADLDRALSLSRKAAELRPGDPMVSDTLAWVYFKQGNAAEARRLLEEALAKAPDTPVLNYHLGAVLAKEGQIEAAQEKLSLALNGKEPFIGRNDAEELLKKIK